MAYIHILCVKRKLFSSKKENRLQHHYRLGSQQVQFLPKQEPITEGKQKRLHLSSSPSLGPLRFVTSHSRFAFALLAITMKKSKSWGAGRGGEREGVEASI